MRNFEAGQAVKLRVGGSLRAVKASPSDRWAWLMLDRQGSRSDFWCGQGVKHENLMGQDLDPGRGWKYRRLCSVPPLQNVVATSNKVQSSQKTIFCLLVQEPCAGTVPSTSYKKWGNVWLIYGSLHYIMDLAMTNRSIMKTEGNGSYSIPDSYIATVSLCMATNL